MAHLNIGDPAPNFTLADQEGNTVKVSDFKGKKLLLYFYPKADTPGLHQTSLPDTGCPNRTGGIGSGGGGHQP